MIDAVLIGRGFAFDGLDKPFGSSDLQPTWGDKLTKENVLELEEVNEDLKIPLFWDMFGDHWLHTEVKPRLFTSPSKKDQ